MKEYKPIDCQLHDHIEHFATLRKVVSIQYLDQNGKKQILKSIIKDWINTGTGEFIVLKEKDLNIRFDFILSIDTVDFKSKGSCALK